ncbi:hypothetical protein C5167_029324 [Papaver somniferum]|nr:hypothetical protein C5167_029324 [Papaver somniferum]
METCFNALAVTYIRDTYTTTVHVNPSIVAFLIIRMLSWHENCCGQQLRQGKRNRNGKCNTNIRTIKRST